MSTTLRGQHYRLEYSTVADWVVLCRTADGMVHLHSNVLNTDLTVNETDLVAVNVGESLPLPLTEGGLDARQTLSTSATVGATSSVSTVCSVTVAPPACDTPAYSPMRGQPLPKARVTDPLPAHLAAVRARNNLTDNQRRVLIAHAEAGSDGLSGDEMAEKMGGEAQYALLGPRRPTLERAGFLEKAGMRPNRRNNPVQVYRCTSSGFALAAQWMEADRARSSA